MSSLSSEEQTNPIKTNKVILQTILGIILLVLVLGLLSMFLEEPMKRFSEAFVQRTGYWGIALGFMIPDALTLPIPPDAFLVAGYLGGLDFWTIAIWASIGSISGGTLGYMVIRLVSNQPTIRKWLDRKIVKGQRFMKQYGLWALGIAALTPLPYSVICWACAVSGVRLVPFVLVSLLRFPRVIAYLVLIQQTMDNLHL